MFQLRLRHFLAGFCLLSLSVFIGCQKAPPPPMVAEKPAIEKLNKEDVGFDSIIPVNNDSDKGNANVVGLENAPFEPAPQTKLSGLSPAELKPAAPHSGISPLAGPIPSPGVHAPLGFTGRSGATSERLLRTAGGVGLSRRSLKRGVAGDKPVGNEANGAVKDQKALQDTVDNLAEADSDAESYQHFQDNPFKAVKIDPLATLSAAVDTAAYSNVRARLNEGVIPPKDMVRIADFLNYFNYEQAAPKDGKPVAFKIEMAACPWNPKHQLLKVGLKSKVIEKDKLPARNLVFLIDTSGSMNQPNRLPLVIESMKLLVEQLTDKDRVSIVTYAGNAGLRLPPTPGNQKERIINEITNLQSGGSTNGEGGIKLAYEQAEKTFIKDGINRVILATDGDFNVGVSDNAQLIRMIEDKRKTGVYLTILGFGMGNLHDDRLEQLAHHGNGHYAYIDTFDEAKKMFVEQGAALVTVAKDVKLQIEFNPAKVSGYRLIGYENRVLKNEDFRNDAKDAGDMGCGHNCTVLFEIVPTGEKVPSSEVEPLKYQTVPQLTEAGKSTELLTTRMRYKDPETDKASEVSATFDEKDIAKEPSKDFQFASSVAAYGMFLRGNDYLGSADLDAIQTWAKNGIGPDLGGHRGEFIRLIDKTKELVNKKNAQPATK